VWWLYDYQIDVMVVDKSLFRKQLVAEWLVVVHKEVVKVTCILRSGSSWDLGIRVTGATVGY
jgi:hypothetical protein